MEYISLLVLLIAVISNPSLAQPQGQTCVASATLGQTAASGCTVGSNQQCGSAGANNYISYGTTSYSSNSDGRFTVSFKTNSCPNNAKTNLAIDGITGTMGSTACCNSISLPVSSHVPTGNDGKPVPLRGTIGYSLFGVNIYGAMENGFALGFACSNGKGSCPAGLDVDTCYYKLVKECGFANVKRTLLPDVCGGHANPYHFHSNMRCEYEYNVSNPRTNHSALIGFGLDGIGIYGAYENINTIPTDLDACGGHFGDTPDTVVNGVTFSGGSNKYHYHMIDGGPSTINCFGPVSSATAAKQLYSTCSSGFIEVCTSKGLINYDDDCPIFNQQAASGGTYNLDFTETPTCTADSTTNNAMSSGHQPLIIFLVVTIIATFLI